MLRDVSSALDYAHSKGVVHRDIKPSNVMFDEHGNAYLVDFGIAKLVAATHGLTETGRVIGTWGYMAPEQWRAGELTPATDQYALGIMTYALVTGQMPFEAQTPANIMHKHLHEMPPPPNVHRPDVPDALTHVIERALAKDPRERFPTCTAFAQAFDAAIRGNTGPKTAFFTAPVQRKPAATSRLFTPSAERVAGTGTAERPIYRHPAVWGLVALLVVMAGVIGFLVLGGGDDKTPAGDDAQDVATPTVDAMMTQIAALWTPTLTEMPALDLTRTAIVATNEAVQTQFAAQWTPTPTGAEVLAPVTGLTPTPNGTATLLAERATRAAQQTATGTPAPTGTPDLNATLQAELALLQTQTAEAWTLTPTVNVRATAEALLAQTQAALDATATHYADLTATQIARDLTATATLWTFTPTPTATATPTPVLTNTLPTATPDPLPDPLDLAQNFAGGNDDWTPVIQEFDGVEMVLVPAGCFMMGSNDGDDDERPVHEVCFDEPFWIDRYEVTNAQFAAFGGQAERDGTWAGAQQPRERITWFEARDFCEARGARLPNEAEWEYAARGPDALVYPWGNEFEADNVVYAGGQTVNVGSKPGGVSWVGALDLSGNVWEWVNTIYRDYPYRDDDGRERNNDANSLHVLRGGSWYRNNANLLRAANRSRGDPDFEFGGLGFRCARSAEGAALAAAADAPTPNPDDSPFEQSMAIVAPYVLNFDPVGMTGEIAIAGAAGTIEVVTIGIATLIIEEGYAGLIAIAETGSAAGFERFCVEGSTDIAIADRQITDAELEACRALGREILEFSLGDDPVTGSPLYVYTAVSVLAEKPYVATLLYFYMEHAKEILEGF